MYHTMNMMSSNELYTNVIAIDPTAGGGSVCIFMCTA